MKRFSLQIFAALLIPVALHAALPEEAMAFIQQAGNAATEEERAAGLEKLAALPAAGSPLREEAKTMAALARAWTGSSLNFYSGQFRGKGPKATGDYDFKVAADSPLQPLTGLYRGRMLAWALIESSTIRGSAELSHWFKDEATKSFRLAAEAFPKNPVARMYLGEPTPWPKEYAPAAGAPEWAVLQRENLDRLRDIIHWWIDKRQRPDGFFGGGRGDDCEMWRWWASLLLGFDDPEIRAAQLKTSKSAMKSGDLKTAGFNTEIADVEHAAEDTTDNLIPLLLLEPDEPRWTQHARKLVDMMRDVWTGRNERGQLQFKGFYFSATEVAPQPQRAFDVMANVGALHPALVVWQRTGDAALGATICAWLDTWVDATARAENGKPAGMLPAAIHWPDGAATGAQDHWWEPVKPGAYMYTYYLWPSILTELTDAFMLAHVMTGEDKYLQPLRSMAAIRLRYLKNPPTESAAPGTEAWCAPQLAPRSNANSFGSGLVKTLARCKALTGTPEFDELIALESGEFVVRDDAAGRRDLEAALRVSLETLRGNFAGFTSEVRATDRVLRFVQFLAQDYDFDGYKGVNLPKHELLYRMVTGDANAPRFPQPAVRWVTPPDDLAVLVTDAGRTRFAAELFHFGKEPRAMSAELHRLKPGDYDVQLLADGKAIGDKPARLHVEQGHASSTKFSLPPQRLCVLQIQPAP